MSVATSADQARERLPALLTLPEVSHELRCSRRHIYSLVERGELRVVHVGVGGRAARVPRSDLDRYLASIGAADIDAA